MQQQTVARGYDIHNCNIHGLINKHRRVKQLAQFLGSLGKLSNLTVFICIVLDQAASFHTASMHFLYLLSYTAFNLTLSLCYLYYISE